MNLANYSFFNSLDFLHIGIEGARADGHLGVKSSKYVEFIFPLKIYMCTTFDKWAAVRLEQRPLHLR